MVWPALSAIRFSLSATGSYNIASRCLGTSTWRIIVKNLLPYLVSVIMLRMALSIPGAIGSEVFITYIGLGLPATVPSLGNLINEGRKLMMSPSLRYQLIYPPPSSCPSSPFPSI